MKEKHIVSRLEQASLIGKLSGCCRRGVGAVACNKDNVTLAEAYNGWLRGSDDQLCGGNVCDRAGMESGHQMDVGCVHAEQNLIINAARVGVSLVDSIVFVSAYPCVMCAKALVQVGVSTVYVRKSSYPCDKGLDLLRENGVVVEERGIAPVKQAVRTVKPSVFGTPFSG